MIVKEAIDFVTIRSCAHSIADHAHAAFYMDGLSQTSVAHQEMHLLNEFKQIASILGYRLEKIEPEAAQAQAAE